jgi:hypothetical protein
LLNLNKGKQQKGTPVKTVLEVHPGALKDKWLDTTGVNDMLLELIAYMLQWVRNRLVSHS